MRWLNVGKIVNTHGLKGEVRVMSVTDFPELRYKPGNQLTYFSNDGTKQFPVTVRTHRTHKQFDLISFEEFDSIDEVEKLKGGYLKISEDQLTRQEELDEHEYYYHEIIGCKVYSEEGKLLGTVTEILSPGANDVWVVQHENNKNPYYIPYIEPVVKKIDIINKEITIHVMEGLIE